MNNRLALHVSFSDISELRREGQSEAAPRLFLPAAVLSCNEGQTACLQTSTQREGFPHTNNNPSCTFNINPPCLFTFNLCSSSFFSFYLFV